jgi:hypothetical protein
MDNFRRIVAMAILSAALPVGATTFQLNTTKLNTGLFEVSGGWQLIQTQFCAFGGQNLATTMQIDYNSGEVVGSLDFGASATCAVRGVYGPRPFMAAGTSSFTGTYISGSYFVDPNERVIYRGTSTCLTPGGFQPVQTYTIASPGPTYRGGVGFGTINVTGSSCNLVGIYEWQYLAGGIASVSVSKGGNGNGTVSTGGGEISCGATCTASFATGTSVVLNAAPNAGSVFSGWSGGGCSGSGSCSLVLLGNAAPTALFTDAPGVSPLINISTRGQVLTGNDVMIAGFIIGGSSAQTVVINVAGPSLVNFGISNALADPMLTLVRADQTVVASNDDWQSQSAANVAAIRASGFQPNHPQEPAIIATLVPGAYTAIISGFNGGTGVGLVGVFSTP